MRTIFIALPLLALGACANMTPEERAANCTNAQMVLANADVALASAQAAAAQFPTNSKVVKAFETAQQVSAAAHAAVATACPA